MDETTQVTPLPEQTTRTQGGTVTTVTVPTKQITETAEVIARVGPDPVMLGTVITFGAIMVMAILALITRFQKQQENNAQQMFDGQEKERTRWQEQLVDQRTHFRDELKETRDEFRQELQSQRDAHVESLNKIVDGHKEGMEKVANEISTLGHRVAHLEVALQTAPPVVATQVNVAPVAKPARKARKGNLDAV
ncbi:hypothetical protein Dxin01_00168 [Deinococcus xinjiangensis]|uniref:Uncharacterized protein n=1 Tax=Deinococcus xinjiangensis TaxID=457454 RepID=A0ABP9V598_9DEIO